MRATAASWRRWPSAFSRKCRARRSPSDQLYREADLAIDFREDVEPLAPEAIDRIVALFHEAGAVAKVSSIHVNGWFGQYDKLSMTRVFVRDALGLDLETTRSLFVFCGDSPNDEPMFRFFPYGCGVANVRDFASRMSALPAFVSEARGGAGFRRDCQQDLVGACRQCREGLAQWPPSRFATSGRASATWR